MLVSSARSMLQENKRCLIYTHVTSWREKPELKVRSPGFSHSEAHGLIFVTSHLACLVLRWFEIKPMTPSLYPGLR